MVSAAITTAAGRPVALNWGSSVLAADLHSGNRKEVARAEFEDPREVTVTFAPSSIRDDDLFYAYVEAELHIGAGAMAYVVPVPLSLRGCCVHFTAKTLSVRLFSQNDLATQQANLKRTGRWAVGIALGQTVQQPAWGSGVGPISNTGVYQPNGGIALQPWTTAIQLLPVRNGSIPIPDPTLVYVKECHTPTASSGAFAVQTQYEWQAAHALINPMPLQARTNAIQIRNSNTNDPNAYFHLLEHWRL